MSAILQEARTLRRRGEPQAAADLLVETLRRGDADGGPPTEGGSTWSLFVHEAGRFLSGLVEKDLLPAPATRVRLLGQCTTAWLQHTLTAVTWGRRQPVAVSEGNYDQVYQDLLAQRPGEADVVILLPWTQRLLGGDAAGVAAAEERVQDELAFWKACWERARALGCKILQVGYDATHAGPAGVALAGQPGGDVDRVRQVNRALREALPVGAAFLDLEQVAGDHGRRRFYDARRWYWTRQPFSEAGTLELARAIQASLRALLTGPKKVLVLDLDNTLWGGVVGETGPLGVQLGESADGEAFRAFQGWCKALSQRGVVLAVASKNEVEDARGPFETNPAMALTLADLAAFEANWGPKSESIRRIAEQLNLGLDSFVFVDDNPAEREQVRQALPDVEVVDLPLDPAGYIAAVEAGGWFEAVSLTSEDALRTRQYVEERQRRELQSSSANLDDYLDSLEMRGDVREVDEADLPRVVQLLGKTNQWNLTTRRHSHAAVEAMVRDPRSLCLTLRMTDRFGDHGLVAVALAVPEDDVTLRLDTWLMSCRVIARTAEQFFFRQIVERARALGYARLIGEYLPTKKNRQVEPIFRDLGLLYDGALEGDGARYIADLATLPLPDTFVRVP
jgi:FkbH-like protein